METDTSDGVSARPGQNDAKTRFWREHIDAWQQSNLTQRAYATQQGLPVARFVYWKNKFYPNRASSRADFVPVRVATPSASSLRLILPSGVIIECTTGTDVSWLRALLGLAVAS